MQHEPKYNLKISLLCILKYLIYAILDASCSSVQSRELSYGFGTPTSILQHSDNRPYSLSKPNGKYKRCVVCMFWDTGLHIAPCYVLPGIWILPDICEFSWTQDYLWSRNFVGFEIEVERGPKWGDQVLNTACVHLTKDELDR